MQEKGYVSYVGSNKVRGTELWSFRLRDVEKWFNCGSIPIKLQKNDYISFDVQQENGKYNVDVGSITPIKLDNYQGTSDAPSPKYSGRSVSGRDEYWVNKENRDISNEVHRKSNELRIQWQSARNAAISLVDTLVREKLLKLSDAAKADNVAVVLGKVQDLTNQFYTECQELNQTKEGTNEESN